MGGQLIKGYSIEGESITTVGLLRSWKLYKGKKEGTQALASIFLIQKKQLKKNQKEQIIKIAKKEATNLVRVRHPGVLAVVETLTEDENILAYVTERVQGNLSILIKQNKLLDLLGSQLQLKLSIYPFLQTLQFLQQNVKQSHLNISLDSIFLTSDGKFKLSGFGLNQLLAGDQLHSFDQKLYDLSFSSPQLALQKKYNKSSDIFSIGVVILKLLEALYKQYKPLIINDKNEYQKQSNQIKKYIKHPIIQKTKNPTDLQILLKGLLCWQSNKRLSIIQILNSRWMNDQALMTVKYLDKISNYQNKQQLQFLKGLAGVLDDFQSRVVLRIIFPKLIDLLKFNHLIASIVYIIIDAIKKNKITQDYFKNKIWPFLKNVTQGKQMTAQAIYLLVFNMDKIQKYIGQPDMTTHILPLYIKCFQCPPKLKQLALSNVQKISKKVDYQFFKTRIIPKLLITLKDPSLQIRKDSLKALYAVIKVIDPQTISSSILPGLEQARKAGSDPFVNSIINSIYNNLTATLSGEIISSKILPNLIPYLSDPSISKSQFYQFKSTILAMINKIEKERQKSFDNSVVVNQTTTFNQSDYKFQEIDENKNQNQQKNTNNYSFLSNYIEVKTEVKAELKAQETKKPIKNDDKFEFTLPTTQIKQQKIEDIQINKINQGDFKLSKNLQFSNPSQPENKITNDFTLNFNKDLDNQPFQINFSEIPKIQTKNQMPNFNFNTSIISEDINSKEKSIYSPTQKKLVGPSMAKQPKIAETKQQVQPAFNFDYLNSNNNTNNFGNTNMVSTNLKMDLDFNEFGILEQPKKQFVAPKISKPIIKPLQPIKIQNSNNFGNFGLQTNPVAIASVPKGSNPFAQLEQEEMKAKKQLYNYFMQEPQKQVPKSDDGYDLI